MNHWASKYVGVPYKVGGRSLAEGVDCWGLVREIYTREFNITLPILEGISFETALDKRKDLLREATHGWERIDKAEEGCAVVMGLSTAMHHVGLWVELNGGRVLHCWHGQSSVIETLRNLKLRGINRIQFYRHQLWTP